MNTSTTLVAIAFSVFATAAMAQSAGPQVPNPANPFPEEPIATDGSSLLPYWTNGAPSMRRAGQSPRSGFGELQALARRSR